VPPFADDVTSSVAMILQNHLVLAVHDLEGSAGFFRQLGFGETNRPPGWVFLSRDNTMVMLGECPDSLPAAELGDHSYVAYFRVDDVDAHHATAVSAGLDVAAPEDKSWGMREFVVHSPEGHGITIGQSLTPDPPAGGDRQG
jgi:catechol 2,3-dioxygenase-like lactoylglutathione lyase family enzyme